MRYLKPTITAVAAISFMLTGAQGTTAVSPPERVNAALRGPAGPCQSQNSGVKFTKNASGYRASLQNCNYRGNVRVQFKYKSTSGPIVLVDSVTACKTLAPGGRTAFTGGESRPTVAGGFSGKKFTHGWRFC